MLIIKAETKVNGKMHGAKGSRANDLDFGTTEPARLKRGPFRSFRGCLLYSPFTFDFLDIWCIVLIK